MRDVAVVSFAQTKHVRAETDRNEVEMLMPVLGEALGGVNLTIDDIGFTCSGSTDFLAGQAFSFVMTLDAVGPYPPIQESHVEMDGAWALYEAWVKLQIGEIDTAFIYAYGKSSPGPLRDVLSLQLDPYTVMPLRPDTISLAAMQARKGIDAGLFTEADMAEVAASNRRNAADNPFAQMQGSDDPDKLLAADYLSDPLRLHDCPPISDGACALVMAAGDRARELTEKPAWIRGIEHRVDIHALGVRDLLAVDSARLATQAAGVHDKGLDFAELHAPFTSQELLLRRAMSIPDSVPVNPSGGSLASNPVMAAGLIRIGEAATRLSAGQGQRAVATATSGPLLQQNLVCVLETN